MRVFMLSGIRIAYALAAAVTLIIFLCCEDGARWAHMRSGVLLSTYFTSNSPALPKRKLLAHSEDKHFGLHEILR